MYCQNCCIIYRFYWGRHEEVEGSVFWLLFVMDQEHNIGTDPKKVKKTFNSQRV